MLLSSKTILLGISGGIAAYKACDLVRRLRDQGATVHVVMTQAACEFITPLTLQALSGNPVHTGLFNLERESKISHIALADLPDLIVIAPATTDLIAKTAHGICDDLLTTLLCATRQRILMCPSMNTNMWNNPATQSNLSLLKSRGIHILDPGIGSLACGYEGMGRLPDPEKIVHYIEGFFASDHLKGLRVLITAGPTWESIDPVRHITSPASGKTGYALAEAAKKRGAEVCLISGPAMLTNPVGVQVIRVQSADEMAAHVFKHFSQADITIATAAVSDFRPTQKLKQKAKKTDMPRHIQLTQNEDILARLGKEKQKDQILVGFAAETHNIEQEALRKLKSKNLDLICANDISRPGLGFGSDRNQLTLYGADGISVPSSTLTKSELSDFILDAIEDLLKKKRKVSVLRSNQK